MMPTLSNEELTLLAALLSQRRAVLSDEIAAELRASENQSYQRLAGEVHDRAEESIADLLTDVDNAMVSLHINELRDIEAAHQRLDAGTYGTCCDCGVTIRFDRLRAFPSAKRCLDCQRQIELRRGEINSPKL